MNTGTVRYTKCEHCGEYTQFRLPYIVPSHIYDETKAALEALQVGCKERYLDIKGDGNWSQMVGTVLTIIDNNRLLRSRLQELQSRA